MFWTATDSAIAGGTYNLAITGTGLTGISDPTSLRVVFLTDGTDFGFIGDHSPGSGTTARRDNISGSTNSFGQYYIGIPGDNTPAGSNVTVAIPPVELTFDQVTQAGTTSLTTSSQGPPPPSGFKLGAPPTYYELTTTATFTDNIQVCINYSGISFANESKLKLFHFEDTDGDGSADAWVDRTTTMDPTNHIICASVTSLSPFAIFEPENPIVQAITAPIDPVQVGTTIAATATFTDPSENDTHTAIWDWGDGTTSPGTVDQIADTVSGSHTYTTAGVYTVTLTVTDNDGDSGQSIFQFIVVYDPEGGFVTGGGWINSPAGAYAADSSITGKANFGFVSKYNQGATVPTGETKFNFKVADLNFHSGVYEWLVVAGAKAQYKGTGTINNAGNYGFMLTAIDEALTPSTDVDFFRIKIWDKDNGDAAIYDNQMGDEDDADPTTTIGGGNIKIHKDNTAAAPMAVATSLTAIPEETRLVPAFPNPSNPEVWIPYHLSADNEVFIRIYDVTGHLIRELNLGHQTAGFYDSRAKAAYWDGRNGYGEDVASGLYFYTLQAGSFAATQKLHIKR